MSIPNMALLFIILTVAHTGCVGLLVRNRNNVDTLYVGTWVFGPLARVICYRPP